MCLGLQYYKSFAWSFRFKLESIKLQLRICKKTSNLTVIINRAEEKANVVIINISLLTSILIISSTYHITSSLCPSNCWSFWDLCVLATVWLYNSSIYIIILVHNIVINRSKFIVNRNIIFHNIGSRISWLLSAGVRTPFFALRAVSLTFLHISSLSVLLAALVVLELFLDLVFSLDLGLEPDLEILLFWTLAAVCRVEKSYVTKPGKLTICFK